MTPTQILSKSIRAAVSYVCLWRYTELLKLFSNSKTALMRQKI